MKIVEITEHLTMPINNEEADLLAKFSSINVLEKVSMDEREQLIANNLVNKSILSRKNHNGQIKYFKNVRD